MLRSNMSFPLVFRGERGRAPCEMEDTDKRPGVLLLDVILEEGLVFERLRAVGTGVGGFAAC